MLEDNRTKDWCGSLDVRMLEIAKGKDSLRYYIIVIALLDPPRGASFLCVLFSARQ